MGKTLVSNVPLNINDGTATIDFPLASWDRVSIQMTDPAGRLGTAVLEFKVGVDGVTYNSFGSAVTFNATGTTHWRPANDVENASHGQISVTTPEGTDETVYFTVFAYNVED